MNLSHSEVSSPFPEKKFEYLEASSVGAELAYPAQFVDVHSEQRNSSGAPTQQDWERRILEAHDAGFREGSLQAQKTFEAQIATEHSRINKAVQDFDQQRSEYYAKVEVELVHLALAIAAKILHREVQVDRMLLAGIVRVALDKFEQGTSVRLRVPVEDAAEWNHHFCVNPKSGTNIEVIADESLKGQDCILETELGTTQLGIDAQLKEVESGFFDLLAQRPAPR